MSRRSLRRLAPAVVASLALILSAVALVRADDPKVIEIEAKRFEFTPNEITLQKDQPVVLRLHSQDVTHGFYQKALGIDASIDPGKTTDVPLTPHQAGRFVTICDHFCGAGHGNMKMTITVE